MQRSIIKKQDFTLLHQSGVNTSNSVMFIFLDIFLKVKNQEVKWILIVF